MRDISGKKSAGPPLVPTGDYNQKQQQQPGGPGLGFHSLQHQQHYAGGGGGGRGEQQRQQQGALGGSMRSYGSREHVTSPCGSGIGGSLGVSDQQQQRQTAGAPLIAPGLLTAAYGTSVAAPLCTGNNVATAKRSRMTSELWAPC